MEAREHDFPVGVPLQPLVRYHSHRHEVEANLQYSLRRQSGELVDYLRGGSRRVLSLRRAGA